MTTNLWAKAKVPFHLLEPYERAIFDEVLSFSWLEDQTSPPSGEYDDNELPIASIFDMNAIIAPEKEQHILQKWQIANLLCGHNIELIFSPIEDTNWLERCYKDQPPVEAGKFYIHSSHHKPTEEKNKINLEINAATAFGSGDHPTTFGCLELLQNLKCVPKNILDMGCGSGILAIAAAKLFPNAHIDACDIDPEALIQTQRNASTNTVQNQIICHLVNKNKKFSGGPYDIIFANILAKPLIQLAPNFRDLCQDTTDVILAGLLERQGTDVIKAFKQQGFTVKQELLKQDWLCILLCKSI